MAGMQAGKQAGRHKYECKNADMKRKRVNYLDTSKSLE